jgi:ligand-binding sensor domain-containing protein
LCAILGAMLSLSAAAGAARPTFGADPTYLIDTWETEDGLPENSATAMVQTRDGYLWFGTFNGLVRFDGVKFVVFDPTNTPQLPSAGIVNLHLDNAGRLWVSTLRGIVVLVDYKWRTVPNDDGWERSENFARTFAERANGDLLVTTFDGRVLECTNGRFRALPTPPGERGKGYLGHVDESGQWWVMQHGFIGRWDGIRWVEMMPSGDELSRVRARDGGLWIFRRQELQKYRGTTRVSSVKVPGFRGGPWSMYEDSDGNVWVCTHDQGLFKITPSGESRHWTTANGLSYEGVRFVFEDREGTHWVGTSGGGLMRFKTRQARTFGAESGLAERVVNSVSTDAAGNIWAATYGKGLFRWADGKATRHQSTGLPEATVYGQSVLTDRAGRIWLGTFGQGLWVVEKQGARRIPAGQTGGGNVISLFEDSAGRIWMGGGQVVSVYDEAVDPASDLPQV